MTALIQALNALVENKKLAMSILMRRQEKAISIFILQVSREPMVGVPPTATTKFVLQIQGIPKLPLLL